MAVISKSVSWASHTLFTGYQPAFGAQPTNSIYPGPFLYADSASPLAATTELWQFVAATVGQVFLSPPIFNAPYYYFECTVAGTTGAYVSTLPQTVRDIAANLTFTWGTATFRCRLHHGWSRASRFPVAAGKTITYSRLVYLMASTSSMTYSSASWATDNPLTGTEWGMFSVSKAAELPTTYAAGASVTVPATTNVFEGSFQVIRGMTFTANPTPGSLSYYTREWVSYRYLDCVFNVSSAIGPANVIDPVHTGTTRALRCTFNSTNASQTTVLPVWGSAIGSGWDASADACTFTRATASTTRYILGAGGDNTASHGASDASLIGGDLSAIASPSFGRDPLGYGNYNGGRFEAYGWNVNATYTYTFANTIGGTQLQSPNTTSYTGAGTTELGRYDYFFKDRTYTRSSGANDGIGAFSVVSQCDMYRKYSKPIWVMNTRTSEGFTLSFDFQYTAVAGITGLSEEDIWIEVVYLDDASSYRGRFVSSVQNRETLPGLFLTGAGPRIYPASGSTWTGALASAVKQRMTVTVSPRRAGPIAVRIGQWLCPWTESKIGAVTHIPVYIDLKPIIGAA